MKRRREAACPLLAGLLSVTLALAPEAGAVAERRAGPAPWETVAAEERWAGYAWRSGYSVRLEEERLRVRVGIHLVPLGGVTRLELERAERLWTGGIEAVWGGRFAIETPAGGSYPIEVQVDFRGPRYHHEVVVRPGRGRTDELDWRLEDGPEVAAHEVGHMLGAFDDYRGGASGPAGPQNDPGSVMAGSPKKGAEARPRHFEGVRRWFVAKTGIEGRVVGIDSHGDVPQRPP